MRSQADKVRPVSIVVLTVLAIVLGAFDLIIGAPALIFAFFIYCLTLIWKSILVTTLSLQSVSIFSMTVAVSYTAMACVYFITAHGYWTGRGWGWTLGLTSAILGMIPGVFSLVAGIILEIEFMSSVGVPNIVVNAIMVCLLTRLDVKEYFGRTPPTAPPTQTL